MILRFEQNEYKVKVLKSDEVSSALLAECGYIFLFNKQKKKVVYINLDHKRYTYPATLTEE